jgi:uncharacterized membrane protein YraQ (UPF0718 family)
MESLDMSMLGETLSLALSAAPWLLVGLFAAGLIKAFVPEASMKRWIGGTGLKAVSRAALVGAPLPLCSCGAIPTAFALHRGGAGRGPTAAFLIGTPGIGVDSIAITYALLGPFMALARALGAVVTAVVTGLLVGLTGSPGGANSAPTVATCSGGCCGEAPANAPAAPSLRAPTASARIRAGVRYAFTDLLDDISTWILIGLIVAGAMMTLVPPHVVAAYGSGLDVMLLMALIGIPLYICATAATPIAAGMLAAGVSPGTALVFLLAGPITSAATLGLLHREMGKSALGCYLAGILGSTVALGATIDWMVQSLGIDIAGQIGAARELLPDWAGILALVVLLSTGVRPLRRMIAQVFARAANPSATRSR